jgi:hypothetical protein
MSRTLPPHPLDHPGVVKILLGPTASATIRATGDHHLVMTRPANHGDPPEAAGRMILVCLPLDLEVLNAAARVALGKARATTIRNPKSKP